MSHLTSHRSLSDAQEINLWEKDDYGLTDGYEGQVFEFGARGSKIFLFYV